MLTKKIQKLNLLDYSIYHECDPNMQLYFDISDIQNRTLGFGKHSFEISVSSPFMSVTNPMYYLKWLIRRIILYFHL